MVAENVHPPAYLLDEIAAGNDDAATLAHIAGCGACQTYVERLTQAAEGYAETQTSNTETIVARARKALIAADAKARAAARVRIIFGTSLGLSLAAATALLITRTPNDERDLWPPAVPVSGSSEPLEDSGGAFALRFKGKLQLALVIDRKGVQQRTTHDFALRPHDAVRVEVSVDQSQPMLVGFLADDGAWIPLIGPAELGNGVHVSEDALNFDAHPTPGRVIAGPPNAVNRARASRDFSEVTTLVLSPDPDAQ